MFTIEFVCTANVCRSPMAEGLMRERLKKAIGKDVGQSVNVRSSGIFAYDGNPPSQNSVRICARNGIDISPHRSRPFDKQASQEADLILVMSAEHLSHIRENFPEVIEKTFLFKAYSKNDPYKLEIRDSVPDPIGMEAMFYEKTFDMLSVATERALPKIIPQIQKKSAQNDL